MDRRFLDHFLYNRRSPRPTPAAIESELAPGLKPLLVRSLQSFQLGEAAGGRIHQQVLLQRDPALDPSTRLSIQLYVEEEWRHARELELALARLGAPLIQKHWSNAAFTYCRRLFGFRVKLLTMATAEVVGIVYYRALAAGAGSPSLALVLSGIAADEEQHLRFQAEWFAHVLSLTPRWWRSFYAAYLTTVFAAILSAALLAVWVEHNRLLRRVGLSFGELVESSLHEVALARAPLATSFQPQRREHRERPGPGVVASKAEGAQSSAPGFEALLLRRG